MAWKRARQKYILLTITWRNLQEDGAFQIDFKNLQWTIKWWAFNLGSNCIFFKCFFLLLVSRVDSFLLKTKFVGLVERITIEHDNTGVLPDWNLDKVLCEYIYEVLLSLRNYQYNSLLSIRSLVPPYHVSNKQQTKKIYIARKRRHYSEIINWQFFLVQSLLEPKGTVRFSS